MILHQKYAYWAHQRSIINKTKLALDTENDLLTVINELYLRDIKYPKFYELFDFKNVDQEIFDIKDLTSSIWLSIYDRLQQKISYDDHNTNQNWHEYKKVKCFAEIENKPMNLMEL